MYIILGLNVGDSLGSAPQLIIVITIGLWCYNGYIILGNWFMNVPLSFMILEKLNILLGFTDGGTVGDLPHNTYMMMKEFYM